MVFPPWRKTASVHGFAGLDEAQPVPAYRGRYPILDEDLKQQLIDMLAIQLKDNRKAGWVDENLNNVLKRNPEEEPVRAQYAFYEYLKGKNK